MNDTLEFDTGLVTIRAKRWGQEKGIPTLCLHGFLDNAASFDRLAPELHGLDMLPWTSPAMAGPTTDPRHALFRPQ